MDYKEAGVDIDKTDAFVETIKTLVKKTHNENVRSSIGGFAGLYKLNDTQSLVGATDGVGTKLMLAQALNNHSTIGIDLVAMCVNDMICVGAKPLFFLDYYAIGKFDPKQGVQVLEGIVEGCRQSSIPLLGGETAEMPGMYADNKYDLAGFSVGMLENKNQLPKSSIKSGDVIIGVASSGFHSNGYSLVRKLIKEDEQELMQELLTPTSIYTEYFSKISTQFDIKAIANITGGGLWNVPRISEKFDYYFDNLPGFDQIPSCIKVISERSQLDKASLYKTFNMGVGIALVVDKEVAAELMSFSKDIFNCWEIGYLKEGSGEVILK